MLTYNFAPSDRSASSVDEFLAVCQAEPDLAADHLRNGYFEPWLRDTGHPDLATAATLARSGDRPAPDALASFLKSATTSTLGGLSATKGKKKRKTATRHTGH
jgi:hypothetical protein